MTEITELSAGSAHERLEHLAEIYNAAYGDRWDGKYWSRDNFLRWFGGHLTSHPVRLFVARTNGVLVGWIYGFRLPPDTPWFDWLEQPLPDAVAAALSRGRVHVFTELVVLPVFRRRGIASALYGQLSTTWTEADYATMVVLPDNHAAKRLYDRWGWRLIGLKAASGDLPAMEARVLELR